MLLWRVLCFSAIHFGLWLVSAFIAYGFDLDRIRTRSLLANGAAALCSVLQYPHDAVLRSLPSQWLEQAPQVSIAVVLLNSLLWGLALSVIWKFLRTRGSLGKSSGSAAPS